MDDTPRTTRDLAACIRSQPRRAVEFHETKHPKMSVRLWRLAVRNDPSLATAHPKVHACYTYSRRKRGDYSPPVKLPPDLDLQGGRIYARRDNNGEWYAMIAGRGSLTQFYPVRRTESSKLSDPEILHYEYMEAPASLSASSFPALVHGTGLSRKNYQTALRYGLTFAPCTATRTIMLTEAALCHTTAPAVTGKLRAALVRHVVVRPALMAQRVKENPKAPIDVRYDTPDGIPLRDMSVFAPMPAWTLPMPASLAPFSILVPPPPLPPPSPVCPEPLLSVDPYQGYRPLPVPQSTMALWGAKEVATPMYLEAHPERAAQPNPCEWTSGPLDDTVLRELEDDDFLQSLPFDWTAWVPLSDGKPPRYSLAYLLRDPRRTGVASKTHQRRQHFVAGIIALQCAWTYKIPARFGATRARPTTLAEWLAA